MSFPLCISLYFCYSHLHPHLTMKPLFHQLPILFSKNSASCTGTLSPTVPPGLFFAPINWSSSQPRFWFLGHLQLVAYTHLFFQSGISLGMLHATWMLNGKEQETCSQFSYQSQAGVEEKLKEWFFQSS